MIKPFTKQLNRMSAVLGIVGGLATLLVVVGPMLTRGLTSVPPAPPAGNDSATRPSMADAPGHGSRSRDWSGTARVAASRATDPAGEPFSARSQLDGGASPIPIEAARADAVAGAEAQTHQDTGRGAAGAWPSLPHCIELPALPALPVSAPRAKTLLVLPDIEHLQLRLLGGEAIISYESFRMTPAALEDCQGWTVHHLDRQERRTEIGHFRFRAPTLEFQWHADSHVAVADQLRNTMLELVADERCALVALREVTPVEPLLISGGSGLRNVILHIDSLPNVAQLRLDVAASTGAQAFSRMFADAAAGPEQPLSIDLGVAAMDYPLEVTLSFLVPRASSGVVHLQYEVRYRSHYAPLLELSPSNVARDVQLTRSMIQQSEELAHLAHLEATLEYFTQLSEIVSGQSELKLHFRIVLPLGESQVVLAQTARP